MSLLRGTDRKWIMLAGRTRRGVRLEGLVEEEGISMSVQVQSTGGPCSRSSPLMFYTVLCGPWETVRNTRSQARCRRDGSKSAF